MRPLTVAAFLLLLAGCVSPSKEPRRRPAARAIDHMSGGHRAGYDEQSINAACDSIGWTDKVNKAQQTIIDAQMGPRAHRTQHALWHAIRGGLGAGDTEKVIQAFGSPWGNSRPLCPVPENNASAGDYNAVGEDFLYMHHQMVMMLRAAFTAAGVKCVRGWDHIPDPAKWPVPDYVDSGAKGENAFSQLRSWDSYISDPTHSHKWLSSLSLSQLGWAVEFTIHNYLHMRYATARPAKPFQASKPENDGAQVPLDGKFPAGWVYDKPGYDWLADPYGAATNPIFWKIHGYIDHIIELWLATQPKSREHPTGLKRISEDCKGENDCYEWKGLWVGNLPAFAAKSAKGPLPVGASPDDPVRIAEFNRWRLQLQRIGVPEEVPGGDGKDGGVRTAPSSDPLTAAKAAINCK